MRVRAFLQTLGRALGFKASETSSPDEDDAERALDPYNPFSDVVLIEFRDVLDLHSIPPDKIKAVVQGYLEEAHERGVVGVRIIHGKGIGVQREIVRSILSRTPFVIAFNDAPAEAGGWGATVVSLAPNSTVNQQT
jgi:dsDNA-specific endonuclease/ATPase MutS2